MEELELKSTIHAFQMEELSDAERHLVELAIEATSRSYAPYSHFHTLCRTYSLVLCWRPVSGCTRENAGYCRQRYGWRIAI